MFVFFFALCCSSVFRFLLFTSTKYKTSICVLSIRWCVRLSGKKQQLLLLLVYTGAMHAMIQYIRRTNFRHLVPAKGRKKKQFVAKSAHQGLLCSLTPHAVILFSISTGSVGRRILI